MEGRTERLIRDGSGLAGSASIRTIILAQGFEGDDRIGFEHFGEIPVQGLLRRRGGEPPSDLQTPAFAGDALLEGKLTDIDDCASEGIITGIDKCPNGLLHEAGLGQQGDDL